MRYEYPEDFPMRAIYHRKKDRLYFYGDFEDGEEIVFSCTSGKPSSTAAGYAWYQSVTRLTPTQQLINVDEIERIK